MSRRLTLELHGGTTTVSTEVATEEELLAFANKVRQAGGANVLEALLPSTPNQMKTCLIANALNFGCQIEPVENNLPGSDVRTKWSDGTLVWGMRFPDKMNHEDRQKICKAVGCKLAVIDEHEDWDSDDEDATVLVHGMLLPKPIGNAADAFDQGVAFTEYRKPEKGKPTNQWPPFWV